MARQGENIRKRKDGRWEGWYLVYDRILNQILKFASVQYAFIMPVLRRSALDSRNTPVKVLAKSEQKKLMEVIYSQMDCFKMAVLMCLFTGLRLGELCALKWSDIDFENKILTVNRTVQRLYAEGIGRAHV